MPEASNTKDTIKFSGHCPQANLDMEEQGLRFDEPVMEMDQ